jgi:GNAT superfamily N-acetyltransferase
MKMRNAHFGDVPALTNLIAQSARGVGRSWYRSEQIEAALGSAWGVDSQLIADGTYFVMEADGQIVACGGWSKRTKLFGTSEAIGTVPDWLDPLKDAARIRAFFVNPARTRQGLGRALLERCERELRSGGFRAAELVATLPGCPFYAAFGYIPGEPFHHTLPNGLTVEFVPMRKNF